MVLLKDVKMKYPGSRAETLRDIDLTIQDGEFVFLVGPSGSGKTTIIKLLTGEIRATGGQIEVNGFDLRTMKRRNLPKLRRSLGVIFQDYRLISRAARTATRGNSPAASSSAWQSPARW